MKNILPSLALLAALLSATNGAGQGTAENPLAPTPSQSPAAQAARRVLAETGLEAKIRHRVVHGGHELIGVGLYQQYGGGPEKMVRWEMKTQLDEQTVTYQQLSGERYFWIRKDLPLGKKQLQRVNLWQFRDAVRRVVVSNPQHAANSWLMLGGLSRLMEEIDHGFTFGPPRESTLGKVPVLIVDGEWKPETRAGLDVPVGRNPEHFPSKVTLTLGNDQVFPMFPYRVEYSRPASGAGEGSEPESLMTLEFYEVRRRSDLEPRSFEYNPGDQEVEDITRQYLLRLGLATGG